MLFFFSDVRKEMSQVAGTANSTGAAEADKSDFDGEPEQNGTPVGSDEAMSKSVDPFSKEQSVQPSAVETSALQRTKQQEQQATPKKKTPKKPTLKKPTPKKPTPKKPTPKKPTPKKPTPKKPTPKKPTPKKPTPKKPTPKKGTVSPRRVLFASPSKNRQPATGRTVSLILTVFLALKRTAF